MNVRELHERILSAAYPLFLHRGIREVTPEAVQRAAGVSPVEFDQEFSSRDALATECLALREKEWTVGVVEAGARARGTTSEGRLLAIFDVFDDWFHRDDYEACTFINVLLEMGTEHPLGRVSAGYLLNIRNMVATLAAEAHLRNPDQFALSWHILMKGSIINAVEGDQKAASRAKEMARDLIARHRSTEFPMELAHDSVDWFDRCDVGVEEVINSNAATPVSGTTETANRHEAEAELRIPDPELPDPELPDPELPDAELPDAAPEVSWSEVRLDLWVGRQDGEFAGMIEHEGEEYSATSRQGKAIGSFTSLSEAKESLNQPPPQDPSDVWWV